jgi:hypothetical protein
MISKNSIILGTARWGSFITKAEAFRILDSFVSSGFYKIDTSTNYPINGQEADFGLALEILAEWLRISPNTGIEILLKVGALDNLGTSSSDLSPEKMSSDMARVENVLGVRLTGVGVHWDHRNESESSLIGETVDFFRNLHESRYRVGLSGITQKAIYANFSREFIDKWEIQVKENLGDSKIRQEYLQSFPNSSYIGYGIVRGGSFVMKGNKLAPKLENEKITIKSNDNHEVASHSTNKMLNYTDTVKYLLNKKNLQGVVIGPRNLEQMTDFIVNAEID